MRERIGYGELDRRGGTRPGARSLRRRGEWPREGGADGRAGAARHDRLDEGLAEDQSRVRSGRAAHILGRGRRLVVSLACAWLKRAKGNKKVGRQSTRDFQDHLQAEGAARAFALVTACHPTVWLPTWKTSAVGAAPAAKTKLVLSADSPLDHARKLCLARTAL